MRKYCSSTALLFLLLRAQIAAPRWFLNLLVPLRSAQAESGNMIQTHNTTILPNASTESETDDFKAFASSENQVAGSSLSCYQGVG